jgi:glycosyltransferase involved in cell wall biosynthesis
MAFEPNKIAYGGTEYMVRLVEKNIVPYMPKLEKYETFCMPGLTPNVIDLIDKDLVVWNHNLLTQFGNHTAYMFSKPSIQDSVRYWIVPSNFSKQHHIENFNIEENKIFVINNAITPLNPNLKKYNKCKKPKIIYTSNPGRGLELLLHAIKKIDLDFELNIYGDWKPEIQDFSKNENPLKWVQEVLEDPRINVYGHTAKNTLRRRISESHIFAYPSTYLETSCISLIEAMSAGLVCVVPNAGALGETSGGTFPIFNWAGELKELVDRGFGENLTDFSIRFKDDFNVNVDAYAEQLTSAIEKVNKNNTDIESQVEYANNTYSWETVKKSWLEWHDNIN